MLKRHASPTFVHASVGLVNTWNQVHASSPPVWSVLAYVAMSVSALYMVVSLPLFIYYTWKLEMIRAEKGKEAYNCLQKSNDTNDCPKS